MSDVQREVYESYIEYKKEAEQLGVVAVSYEEYSKECWEALSTF